MGYSMECCKSLTKKKSTPEKKFQLQNRFSKFCSPIVRQNENLLLPCDLQLVKKFGKTIKPWLNIIKNIIDKYVS